jgi:hypothetical protein
MICENARPTLEEVAATLMANIGRYIELDYDPVPECQRPLTPSKEIEILSTDYKEPLSKFKTHTGPDQGKVWQSKDGNWIFTCLTSTRVDIETGKYKHRALRLDGIRLYSVLVNSGPKGKVRMFPNIRAPRNAPQPTGEA